MYIDESETENMHEGTMKSIDTYEHAVNKLNMR